MEKRNEIFSIIENFVSTPIKKKESPLISIITTFHKGEEFLNNFMLNMIEQSYFKNSELILIDANSPKKEKQIIKQFTDKYENIVHVKLDQNLSITRCLNLAIKEAKGKFLTFAFIDDIKSKKCVEILYNNISQDNKIDLVYGDVAQTSKPNQVFSDCVKDSLFEHSKLAFSKENMIKCLPGPMPLWRKNIHDKYGFFDSKDCNYADDWEMWLRAVDGGSQFKKIDEIVGLYFSGGRSQDSDIEQRREESQVFYKYKHIFGSNFNNFKPYFDQFIGN